MTVWIDEESMRAFVKAGAHRKARVNFRAMGSGKTHGYYCGSSPEWGEAYAMWTRFAKDV